MSFYTTGGQMKYEPRKSIYVPRYLYDIWEKVGEDAYNQRQGIAYILLKTYADANGIDIPDHRDSANRYDDKGR